MKIALGGDHAGYHYKEGIKKYLIEKGHDVTDFGPESADSVDYPDFVHPAATSVEKGENEFGILICGSGNGVCMTANKHQGIRAGYCWNPEVAALTREHNNANMMCLPARFIAYEYAEEIVDAFLNAEFEGGRHQRRVDKINC
jgi:ribose 5-phosphate isomerase B